MWKVQNTCMQTRATFTNRRLSWICSSSNILHFLLLSNFFFTFVCFFSPSCSSFSLLSFPPLSTLKHVGVTTVESLQIMSQPSAIKDHNPRSVINARQLNTWSLIVHFERKRSHRGKVTGRKRSHRGKVTISTNHRGNFHLEEDQRDRPVTWDRRKILVSKPPKPDPRHRKNIFPIPESCDRLMEKLPALLPMMTPNLRGPNSHWTDWPASSPCPPFFSSLSPVLFCHLFFFHLFLSLSLFCLLSLQWPSQHIHLSRIYCIR